MVRDGGGSVVVDDGVHEVVEVVLGSGESVPVDDGGPVVPVTTGVVVVGSWGGGGGAVSGEVEVMDGIHVHLHVHGW